MNISSLQQDYPLVYEAAIRNRAESDWDKSNEDELYSAFSWGATPEGDDFWRDINYGDFDDAQAVHPHLFAPIRKYKYPVGPIKLKLNKNNQIYNYSADIPKHFIKHGSCVATDCTFEIVGYHKNLYIVKVINQDGDPVTQLGYKEDMLEPLLVEEVLSNLEKEFWCVEYSPKFTKSMFDAMLKYCEKKYGAYKRKDVIVSWDNFVNGRYSYFWVAYDCKDTEHVYSQDNNSQSFPIIILDEMLKIIDYRQGIHVEVIKKQPVNPDLKIRRTQPLKLELKKKEFKQVRIIIKSNHVKI